MKKIKTSDGIYDFDLFAPIKKNTSHSKKKYYEEIFMPKFFLNLLNLTKKRKKKRHENTAKHKTKSSPIIIDSFLNHLQLQNNNNNKQENTPKLHQEIKNNRLFSCTNSSTRNNENNSSLPKIGYRLNKLYYGIESNYQIRTFQRRKILNRNNDNMKMSHSPNPSSNNNLNNQSNNSNIKFSYNLKGKSFDNKLKKNMYNFCMNKNKKEVNSERENLKLEHKKEISNINDENIENYFSAQNNIKINIETSSFNRALHFNKTDLSSKFNKMNGEKTFKNILSNNIKNELNRDNKSIKNINILKEVKFEPILYKKFTIVNKSKYKINNYCSFTKTKFFNEKINNTNNNRQIVQVKKLKEKYIQKEEIIKLFLSKKIIQYVLNNNIILPTEQFYFYVNKKYRNKIIGYMKHRINWEHCECDDNLTKAEQIKNANLIWKYYSNRVNFKNYKYDLNVPMKKLKMINLFEKNYEIGNKKNMFLNLISYCDKIKYNVFDIVPFTIIISNTKDVDLTFNALNEILYFTKNFKNTKNTDLISSRKYNEHFWFDKNFDTVSKQYINFNKNFISDKNYWIIKPTDLYQGKCIEICNNFNDLSKICRKMFKGVDTTFFEEKETKEDDEDSDEENNKIGNNFTSKKNFPKMYCCNDIIIQKYLDNPLLYNKRKFDIRCFVLVDSNLNVFFFKEGHLKGCSELYNLDETNKFVHITNYSFQKKSSNFEKFEIGNEISYKDFKKYLIEEGIPLEKFNNMIEQMKFLIKLSFKAVGKKLFRISPVLCFEIFGYDFIIDNDFRPWILEINDNPGLAISSPIIEKIIPRMLDDAFRLTIDKIFETKYSLDCIDSEGNYKSKYKLDGYGDSENVFEFLCNVN